MKKQLLKLFLGAILFLPMTLWGQTYQSVPYSTGFENVPHGSLPTGWINYATGSSSAATFPCAYSHSPNARGGSMYFELESSSGQTEICATCEFEYLQTLMLDFYAVTTNSTKPTTFEIGVMEDSTFVPVDTVDLVTASGWGASSYTRYRVYFNEYYGYGTRIAFRAQKSGSYTVMIDDITIDVAPSCIDMPGTPHVVPSATEVTLDWAPANNSIGYSVYLDGNRYSAYDTTITIYSLSPNTVYNGFLYNICAAGDTSEGVPFTFRTACAPMTVLPYFQDFENENTGGSTQAFSANCWNLLNNGTAYFGYPYISNSTSYNHTPGGSKGLYWYNAATYTTYGDYQCLILPAVDTDYFAINSLQLSFWAKSSSSSYYPTFYVGVLTDPTDINTFQSVDTINMGGNSDWGEHTAYLSDFTGYGQYVGIMALRPTSSWYAYMDDIKLEQIPDCPPVTNIHLTAIDSNMLTIAWSENGNATSWTVEYGHTGFQQGIGTTVNVTSLPFTITGLTPNTQYDIYVTPDCTGDVVPSVMATFRTANVYVNLPLSCDFEDAAQNTIWTLANGGLVNQWHIDSAANNGGANSLFVSNDGTSLNYTITNSTMIYAYCDIMIPTAGTYAYSFDWECQGESSYDYIRAALVPVSTELVAGTSVPSGFGTTGLPSGWIALDGGSKLNLQSSWQTRSSDITISTPGVYHLVFAWRCDGSGGTAPAGAIDNVAFVALSCEKPTNIAVSNLTQTTCNITWHENGSATEWEYQVGSEPIVTVYDTTCSVTGLSANTIYNIRVRSICGEGDTSLWATSSFRTPCGFISLPYSETFESYSSGSSSTGSDFIPCWTRLNNGTSSGGYPYISNSTTYNHTPGGSKGLYWYNATTTGTYGDYQCIVLPPVDSTVDVSTLMLSFWCRASSASYTPEFKVGVLTNPNDITSFVPVDTIIVNSTDWQNFELPLSNYTGNGFYVAIRADRPSSSWYAYLDDVTLDYTPTCFHLDNITLDPTAPQGSTYMTLVWDNASVLSYEVQYGAEGFTLGTGTTLTSTTNGITITGLTSSTSYDVYVRKICSVGDTSEWISATFTTAICDNAMITSIGSESSTGSGYSFPVNNYYRYTLSETIIDSAEMGGPQLLSAISYYYSYATAMSSKTNCSIYLQPTSLSTFASTNDMVAIDSTAVLVYSGDLNCVQGWNTFAFDTNFYYDGMSNLLVIVDDNSNAYNNSSYTFKTEPCSGNKTVHYYSDSNNPDAANPSSFSGSKSTATSRVVMQLISCGGQICAAPAVTSVATTYHDATITWSGSSTTYEVAIKANNDANWPAETVVTGNTYTFSGLSTNTAYTFRLRQDCTIDSLGYSDWTYGTFTTDELPCITPSNVTINGITNSEAVITWSVNGNETNWDVHLWANGVTDQTFTTTTNTLSVNELISGLTYHVAVRALCGIDLIEGDWSDTASFTTLVCPNVEGLSFSNTTFNTIDLHWDANPMAINWVIEYGFAGFSQGHGTSINVTSNSYTVTGLEDGTEYDFYVSAVCGANWISESAHISATTVEMPDDLFTLILNVNDPTMGVVGGAGTYLAGTTVNIVATPFSGYEFVNWSDGNTEASRSIVVNDNITLTAFFAEAQTQGIEQTDGASCYIYPNPATAATNISVSGANGKVTIAVADINGRIIATETLECASDCIKTISVDNLAQGTYFVRITGETVNMVQKLVVK